MTPLSVLEKEYVRQGVAVGVRGDGRGPQDYRAFSLQLGIIGQANGSCRIKLQNTEMLVSVKTEISDTDETAPECGKLLVHVECCPSASPEYDGLGAKELNAELSRVLAGSLLSGGAIDLRSLCIIPGKKCWTMFIDVLVLDSSGNLFDAASVGIRAALANTQVPALKVTRHGDEYEIELSDNPEDCTSIPVQRVPVIVTVSKVGKRFIVDTTLEEEMCADARVTAAVVQSGKFAMVQKGASGVIDPLALFDMLQVASDVGTKIIAAQDAFLAHLSHDVRDAPRSFF